MQQIDAESEPLEKFIILNALQSTNEALFYHVVIKNLKELAPVIYTPTVGEACQKYDRIFRYAVLCCAVLCCAALRCAVFSTALLNFAQSDTVSHAFEALSLGSAPQNAHPESSIQSIATIGVSV